MRRYTQLTRGKRYQIRALLKAGISQSKMAFYLKVHKSTISREIRRNRGHKGYRPRQAHEKAMARRYQAAKRIKMSPAMIILVSHYIGQDFSPEQVSGFLARNYGLKISHETIYKYIWSDKRAGGILYKHLRHSRRKYKKRYGTQERRGRMKGQVSIDLRPAVVEAKSRIGDWEMDTKQHWIFIHRCREKIKADSDKASCRQASRPNGKGYSSTATALQRQRPYHYL